MAQDRFLIAPLQTGWQNDLNPWLIPDDAYQDLRNAFIYEGRLRNRIGGTVLNPAADNPTLNTRLRINLGNTNGAGNIAGNVPGAAYAVGQAFSIGDEIFTVNAAGAPAVMLTTGAATTHTYNTGTGAYDIQGAVATTAAYFYPATPVMGFGVYEQLGVNNEIYVAFDTQFAYQWVGGEWVRMATGVDTWTGGNADFFWSSTWRGATAAVNLLFASNFVVADGIKYWNSATWTAFGPAYGAGGNDNIITAKIIVPFKDRLLLFNTIEITGTNTQFVNRLRYSQNGSPIDAQAWRQDLPGRGGFIDAPTQEEIVSVEFIHDRLIVYFERSTYEIVYTGNEILPFRWQKINTELGVESTFSVVPFDKAVIGMGLTGIHSCTGNSVQRIDQKIQREIFDINNENNGHIRVQGIRDYFYEMIYWSYPSVSQQNGAFNDTYPNRVLTYNYKNNSWAYNDDSITAFGYVQNLDGLIWSAATMEWTDAEFEWTSPQNNALYRQVIAGNQEGYTFRVTGTTPRNAPSLQITDIIPGAPVTITSINHNLAVNDYVLIENVEGTTNLNSGIYEVRPLTADTFTIVKDDAAGTYTGGGTLTKVTPIDVKTKRYNFYIKEGRNASIERVDFFVDRTAEGQITVDYFTNTTEFSLIVGATLSGSQLGTNILETTPYALVPYEAFSERFWHPLYFSADGQFIQLRLALSVEQILDADIALSPFILNGMIFHASPASERLQ